MKLAIIDNAVDHGLYRPVEHWARYLPEGWEAFEGPAGAFPDIDDFSHFILTGSESSVVDRQQWAEAEAGFIREAVGRGRAVLGSCWGAQLLAYALAGPAVVRRARGPEIGWIKLEIAEPAGGLFGGRREAWVFSTHYDEVSGLSPDRFNITSSSAMCAVQSFWLKGSPVWGLQCHPEMDAPTAIGFLRDILGKGGKRGRDENRAALASVPRDSGLIFDVVRGFLAARLP